MPITKTQGYKASDGVVYATIEEAQKAELEALFCAEDRKHGTGAVGWSVSEIAAHVLDVREAILAILTTGPRSRPSTRKRAGTTNPKRAVKRATPAQAEAGFAGMRAAASQGNVGLAGITLSEVAKGMGAAPAVDSAA